MSVSTDGVVTWNQVTDNHGYEVTVTVGGQTQTYKVDQNVTEVDASEFIQGFAGSAEALTVSASVKAYGNLDNEYRTVDSAFSAPATTLPEKVGVLPTPVIANSNVVSEGSKLYVEYKLEGGSVGKEYIDSLTLTLENTVVKTQTYTTKSVDTTGRIEVTYLNDGTTTLPEGTYNAVITANPKYPDLNAPASSEGTVTYGVDPLDAPVLTVSDDASKLSWPAVELSQGKLDSTANYEVQYKEHSEEDWVTVSITNGNAIQQDGNGFYVDLTTLIEAGTLYDFKVIANNNEDLTLGETSSASIQIFKTVVPTNVKIEARDSENKVFAAWTAPTTTEGIDHYQVDVYMDGVLKTSLTTTGVVNELDISGAIDAADENKYTVKVIAIGQHLVNGVFYGDSVVSEESNPVTSGTVAAPEIEFETRAGTSTSYNVYFAGKDATSLPANVEGYNVTITYVLASGATNTWTGVINDVKCDIAQLKNQNGSQFMTTSWGDYANAEFTVTAVALSTNTALHANSDEVTGEDTFELSDIGRELNIQVKTESGRTVVSWNEIPGASYYFYTVQKVGEDNFVGTVQVTEADITDYLTSAGQWSVTVNALAQDGSTVYVNGNKDIRLTVLAAPSVTINTVDDTATANWTAVTGATSYDVVVRLEGTVIKRDTVASDVRSYSLTELIKEKGHGTYTVEVTAVGDGSKFITSLVPGTAEIIITKLTAPGVTFALNAAGSPTVTITPVSGETVESYTVYLYADGELIKTLTNQKAKAINVTNYLKGYKTAEKAVTFKAEVEAIGSLHHNTLTSVKQSAELAEKVGRLPMPTITTKAIQQTDGQLRVYYTIADNDVPLSQIYQLVLELTYTKDNSSTTETYTLNDVSSYDGYFDVSGGHFDGKIDATIEATVKYAALNTAAKSEADLTYNVIDLPDPQLQVADDGSRLYWEAIPMSDNKAVDAVKEFTLRVKKDANATWISEGIGEQIKYDDVNEVFYVDLTNLLNNYSVYEITAKNNEDVTYTDSSVSVITIAKLADVTTVKIVSQSGAVKATWVDSANTAGVSGYRVELLKLNDAAGSYDVWKTYTAAAGETSYTFADEDIDQSAVDTYKVRVTALGTKDYEADVFYADANPVESTVKLVSGQLPTVAETGTIYEENGKLYLKVALNDTNNNYSKISSVQLTKLQGGIMTYEPARALMAELMKATDTDPAYAIFDLSSIYQSGSLAGIEWTATINVVSRNEQLNAGGTYTTTAAYGIEALNMGELSVNSKTGVVSWERVPGATGYKVEVSYNLNQTWTANTDNDGDIITYDIKDPLGGDTLVPGRTYTITVYAYSDKTMENPTGTPATAKLCKLYAPTNAEVNVTADAASVTWTASQTADAAFDHYTVTSNVGSEFETADSSTTSVALTGLDEGAYTFTVKAVAESNKTVGGVYYVDSDAATATGTAYVGTVPADGITDVSITWGKQGKLYFNYQLPVAADDATDLQKAEINAIVEDTVKVTLKSGEVVVGTYTDSDGDGKIDVTYGTGGNSSVPVSSYTNLSATIELESNYELIAGASYDYSVVVPDQGVISFENFNVDVTDGKVTFTGDPHATGYSAVLQEVGSTSSETIEPSAEQRSTVYTFDLSEKLTAGKTYTLTITGTDATGQYKVGVKEIKLYKLVDPSITTTNQTAKFLASGEFIYVDDANAPGDFTTTVTVDGNKGSYADGVVTFDLTKPLHEAEIVVASTGGQVDETTYILDAANTATLTTITGQIPAYKVSSIKAMPNNTEQVTFQFADSSVSALWTKLYAQCQSLIQLSGSGTYGSFVYATNNGNTVTCHRATGSDRDMSVNTATGVLTANFGLQVTNHLVSGQTYDMRVVAYAKNEVRAILGNSETVIEDVGFNRNQLNPSISINTQTGMLVISGMDDDYVKQVEMQVDGSANVTVVKNGDNIFNVAGITDNNVHTLTFTAIANSTEMADSAPVTIEVKQLPVATAEANTEGKLDVTGYNAGEGKLNVTVDYTDTTLADLEQTVDAAADLTGYVDDDVLASAYGPVTVKTQAKGERVTVNAVDRFYVSAAEQSVTSGFSVGQLPAVTMGALTKENGEWIIPYTLSADAALYGTLNLKLGTDLSDINVQADSFAGNNGIFDVDAFVTRVQGTYDYELTTNSVQYPSINSFETQAEEDAYTYNVGQLQAPDVKVNTTTGALTWTAVPNASSYTVKIDNVETDLGTALTYQPTLTAGQEQEITVIANPESGDYTSNSTTVTLYKLENPVIDTVNNNAAFLKSGTFAFTADDTSYDYDTIVTVDGGDGKYENGVVTFDLTKALHEATIEVALKGKAGADNVYTIDADSTATMTTVTGQIPAYKMDSKTVLASGNVEVKFSFKNEADAELWAKLYQQSKSLLQLSGTGTYGTFVYAEKDQTSIACHSVTTSDKDIVLSSATGNITATFGLSGNALQSGVDYDFRVVAYGKSEVAAVLENSTTVIDADAFEITKLSIDPKVDANGRVTFGMTAEDQAATDYVNVTYKGTTKQIAENANLYTLFSIDSNNVSLNTFTFQAVAKDATREDSDPVDIQVRRLSQVKVTLNENGTFSVSGFNKTISTFSVALAGKKLDGSTGYSRSYSAPANNSDFVSSNSAKWLEQDLQTIVATTTTTALRDNNQVNGVFYLNAAAKYVADATTFVVGKLPAVTLGNAIDKDAAGNLSISYTIPAGVDPKLYAEMTLTMTTEAGMTVTGLRPVQPTDNTGVFDVTALKALGGVFDTTLTVTVANDKINAAPDVQTGLTYTYDIQGLAAPNVQVNVETGELTWATDANVTNYKVSVKGSGTEQDVAPVAGTTTYTPALTAGAAAVTYEIWAESTDDQWNDSAKTEVTLYKLKTPEISINDENDTFTVTDSNTDPTGTLVVKVNGNVVHAGENGVYTALDEYGAYIVTAVVEGEGYDADTGIWTLNSETVKAEGSKLGAQLATPTGLKVTVSSGLLAWKAVANATGYEVKVGDAEPMTVTETKYTPTLAVGENTVTITAVTDDPAYSNSEAASVVLYKLPDLGKLSIGSDGAVNYVNNSGISDPYKDTTVTVKVTKADEYTDAWNAETKVVDFDTDAEVHTVTIKVSVAGKTYTNDAKEKVYLIRPGTYSQTLKVQAGKMPEFEIEDVTTNGVNETVVTFVTGSTEDLSAILDTEAVKNSFEYKYQLSGPEQTWDGTPSKVAIDGNKLIVTLDDPTDTSGYKLTYTFDAVPVSDMAGYRGIVKSTDSITFNGNKLETPVVEVVMGENGVPVLTWNAVEGASEYYLEKHLAGNDHVNANYTVTDTQMEVDITSANTEVFYRVTAKGTGVTDSDPVEVTLRMLSGDEVTFGFNATPVNVTTGAISYKLTLAENADVGTTVNNLKKMTYFTTDTNHTVSKTNATSKIVFDAQEVAGQHTMTITGYILGEINGVYYYSKADIAPKATFTYGELATAAENVEGVAATAKNVTIRLTNLQKTMVDATNSYVSVVEQGTKEAVMVSGITVGATYVRVPTTEMGLKAGTTYDVTVVLVPKSAAGTQTSLTCTLTTK